MKFFSDNELANNELSLHLIGINQILKFNDKTNSFPSLTRLS